MKKYISFGIGISLFISPLFVSAQSTNSSNESLLIAVLTQLIQVLEQEVQQLLALQASQYPTPNNCQPQPSTACSGTWKAVTTGGCALWQCVTNPIPSPSPSPSLSITGISGPTRISAGQNGTWSLTVNGATGNLSYSVNWGDQNSYTGVTGSTQNSSTFTHAYAAAGSYTPKFTVTSSGGQSASASMTLIVSISNTRPLSVSATSGQVPLTVTFSAAPPAGIVLGNGAMAINFGDGTWSQGFTQPIQIIHTYQNAGAYSVTLGYYSNWPSTTPGAIYDGTVISVGGTQKTPMLSAINPTQGPVGTSVTLSGSGFLGSGGMLLLDNQYILANEVNSSASGDTSFTFTFPSNVVDKNACANVPPLNTCDPAALPVSNGAHSIMLQNANGTSNTITFTVTSASLSTLTASPASGPAPLSAVQFSAPYPGAGITDTIDFGDGHSATMYAMTPEVLCMQGMTCPPATPTSENTSHTYIAPGVYTAKLMRNGGAIAQTIINVYPAQHQFTIPGTFTLNTGETASAPATNGGATTLYFLLTQTGVGASAGNATLLVFPYPDNCPVQTQITSCNMIYGSLPLNQATALDGLPNYVFKLLSEIPQGTGGVGGSATISVQ